MYAAPLILPIVNCVFAAVLAMCFVGCRGEPMSMRMKELSEFQNTNFLDGGYTDTMVAARPHFDRLIEGLIMLDSDTDYEAKFALFAECIEKVYTLDETIETLERDVFFDAWMQIARIAGFCKTKEDAYSFEQRYLEVRDNSL